MSKNSSGMANPNYTNALQEYDSYVLDSLKGFYIKLIWLFSGSQS